MDLLSILLGGTPKEVEAKPPKRLTREDVYETLQATAKVHPTWLEFEKDESGKITNVHLAKAHTKPTSIGSNVKTIKRNVAKRVCPMCGTEKDIVYQSGVSSECAWTEHLACGHALFIARRGLMLRDGKRMLADGKERNREFANWKDWEFGGWRVDPIERIV